MPIRVLSVIATLLAFGAPVSASDPSIPGGPLDGKVFVSTMLVDQYDAPFDDRLTFAAGTFLSDECERACSFGRSAYYIRTEGDSIAFVVDAACSDAPQSTRWEGRVTGDRIEGTVVWTVERFYWTVQRHATFSGRLVDAQTAIDPAPLTD